MTTTNTSTINPRDLAQRLASPYRRGVALYGSDGSRNVVWGVGETDEEAEADAARQDDVPADLTTAEITPAALAKVAAGAVGLDDGDLDLRREVGIGWVIDIHVEAGDAATAAIEVNEQLTKRGFETLTAAELTAMAESTEAIDTLIDDLHQTSTLPTGETGGVLASYRAALRAKLREWIEERAGEREETNTINIDSNDPFADLVALDDRDGLVGRVREKGARVVAVEILSAAAAAGCGSWDDAALTALVRALEEHAEPEPTHCECGEWSGERCWWSGPESETVTVEWMPEQHRASHTAASNAGVYPANGARHLQVHRKCAASMIEHDGAWCSIVEA